MARELTVYGFAATLIAVPPGATASILVQGWTGEISSVLKQFSGGSLEIMPAPVGTTAPSASLALGSGYLMGLGEAVTVDGAARYYLTATGATAVAYSLRGLSQGF